MIQLKLQQIRVEMTEISTRVMEFEFPFTLILAVSALTLLIVFKLLKESGSDKASSLLLNRIPGPKKLPFIGNLHLLAGKSLPHRVFRDLAADYGPLMRLQLGGLPLLVVSSVEVAKQVVKTHDTVFANRPPILALKSLTYNFTDIGNAPYGEYWRQLRKICTLELFSARRVKSFRSIREEVNASMAESIASNEGFPANLSEKVYLSSFDVTIRASIGKETEEKRRVTSVIKEVVKLGAGFNVADLFPSNRLLPLITGVNFKIRSIFLKMDGVVQRIVDGHRARAAHAMGRSEDLVDVLLKYQQDAAAVHLTDDNIKAVIMDMFLAGGDTSAAVVDWAMSEMVRNPTTLKIAQDEVRRVFDDKGYVDEEKFEELKYLKLVIKETLRLHPPLPLLFPRQNSERCEINGYEIPANTKVMVNAWALGRDPKYWSDAEAFIPERFEDNSIDFKGTNFEFIPFGAGKRICPGMSFGLASVELSLAMLLYHFDWEMPNGMTNEQLDMSEEFGAIVKRKLDLLLIPALKRPLMGSSKVSGAL